MTRSRHHGLALALVFGFSVIAPCLSMGIGNAKPKEPMPMTGCGGDEAAPRADLVCASSFYPAASHRVPQAAPPVAARLPAVPPLVLPAIQDFSCRIENPVAREHGPPPYLLHRALLI